MKIALVIPYYGTFPNYFDLWLKSAEYNTDIHFLIFTDIHYVRKLPKNISLIYMTFESIKGRVQKIFDEKIILHSPYKLCDYRPAYGEIFADYLVGYDFWGHCDLDIIWGNIRKFITDDILDKYDRILTRGHLCLYRNEQHINVLYKKISNNKDINYYDAFHTKYSAHFDEGNMLKYNFELEYKKIYDEVCFADVYYDRKQFNLAHEIKNGMAEQVFKWEAGKLERYYIKDNNILTDEFAYIHLQKRKMEVNMANIEGGFLIIPNEFIDIEIIDEKLIKDNSKTSIIYKILSYKKRIKSSVVNIKSGALKFRIKRLKNKN